MTTRDLGCEPRLSRRELLARLAAAGVTGFVGSRPGVAATEPPPETTRIRLVGGRALCYAPQFVAENLLRGEGFSDVQYIGRTLV